jgi:outer membrane protein assembly factor BamB
LTAGAVRRKGCFVTTRICCALVRFVGCGAVVVFYGIARFASAADWPQLRGPHFDGSTSEQISTQWPSIGPNVIWKRPLKAGFSSFVVQGKDLCTLVLRESGGVSHEACVSLDPETGRERWVRILAPAKYTGVGYDSGNWGAPGNRGGDGPRSTPAIDDGRVYVITSRLVLFCLAADNGEILWQKDLVAEHGGTPITYENAASPVIVNDTLLLAGGGTGQSILGINKVSGEVMWRGHDELLTHSTPVVTTMNGIQQAIFYTRSGLFAVNPDSGENLWRYNFPFRVCAAITPVVAGNLVYCSAGYGIGSGVCRVERFNKRRAVSEVWRLRHNEPVANYWSTPVHKEGHLYGMFGFKKFGTAPMKCVELATGKVKWTQPGFGHGNVIMAGSVLLAMSGSGELVLVVPSREAYREIARSKILTGKCWSTPIVSRGRLYARSTTEGVCIDLKPERLSLDVAAQRSP